MRKHTICISLHIALLVAENLTAMGQQVNPTTGQNYIVKRMPREGTTAVIDLLKLPAAKQGATIEYYDGLGRPLQTIGVAATPNADGSAFNDQITPHVYDGMGREYRQYLPLPKAQGVGAGAYQTNAVDASYTTSCDHYKFYNPAVPNGIAPDTRPFGETIYDGSPLSRVVSQTGPGSKWQSHPVSTAYGTNTAGEVILWTVADNGTLTGGLCYLPGTLYRTAVQDEDKTTTVEYKDMEGRVVRKVADYGAETNPVHQNATTDYVYDDFGRLRWVLPPKYMASLDTKGLPKGLPANTSLVQGAQELKNTTSQAKYVLAPGASLTLLPTFVGGTGFTVSPGAALESLDALAYYYEYDGYGRMIKKKLPGVEPVYMVYDSRDRLVAVQDGEQRKSNRWLYTRYDALNRPVETGYIAKSGTRADMESTVNAAFAAAQYDTPYTGKLNGVEYSTYTRNSFPRVVNKVYVDGVIDSLTYTFYDSYANGGAANLGGSKVYDQTVTTNVTGLPTVSKVKELTTNTWSTTATYYDERGRVIQTVKKGLYPDAKGTMTVSTELNFVGQPKRIKEEQSFKPSATAGAITTSIERRYDYYDSGQLRGVYAKMNNAATEETLATYTYDALGHVLQKKYGGTDQKQHYEYNIRGWLTKINEPNTAGDDFFAMSLAYEAPEVTGGQARYGGNISSMVWRTQLDNDGNKPKKGYGFAYDAQNRLTGSSYATTDALSASDVYTEKSLGYDANGNITSLTRTNGASTATTFGYAYSGNQLLSINGGAAYQYDANGNATKDGYKGFSIGYNELNLPKSVSKGTQTVSYTYDATGSKLAMVDTDNSGRYYHGSMVYERSKEGAFSFGYALHDEGMIKSTDNGFVYQYNLKDHLGNTRAVFKKTGVGLNTMLLQAADYYPFGKSFENKDVPNNRYLYNGKELQNLTIDGAHFDWYDYGARFYDPELGVWHSFDPLAEKKFWISPYAYCSNDPINKIDPDGMDDVYNSQGKFIEHNKHEIDKKQDHIVIREPNYAKKFLVAIGFGDSKFVKNMADNIDTRIEKTTLSAEAYSNVFTNILSETTGVKMNNLYNGSVSVVISHNDWNVDDQYNSPSLNANQNASEGLYEGQTRITASIINSGDKDDNRFLFSTTSNVQNLLGAHEKIGHGQKGLSDHTRTHNVYEYQFRHDSWKNTTQPFKEYMRIVHKQELNK
ncbi:DUF6443 domain-containing protein [uncultured Acetobacteroides sp.]|uniref:DUF6443 domain-containing protein n=1 Tax=uncultured Acetobacteroides sp. TaxID=1760811 RepID=UPI0029F48CE6|nr:DUF6443 domain-containing protein [uncultured Acetobacteroides sp.]